MYFERRKYKLFAKKQLNGRYGTAVLVTLVSGLVSAIFLLPQFFNLLLTEEGRVTLMTSISNFSSFNFSISNTSDSTSYMTLAQNLVSAIIFMAGLNFYLKMSRTPEKISFTAFIEGMNNWWRAILTFFYKGIFIFLWTLCFIIPGIIKAFAYSQMEYLVAEFPDISIPQAMNISKKITKDYKMDIFVMYLSFIGWEILAAFTFQIGQLWLRPYMNMTFINAYHAMLKNALDNNIIKAEDLQ